MDIDAGNGGQEAKRGRGGRPAAGREHEVTARLLASASRLFLERGFDGTTCDQVALDARAGKASIYTRYANKEALFAAVIDNLLAGSGAPMPADAAATGAASLPQRLAAAARQVLADALAPDTVALVRLLLSQQARFAGIGLDQLFWKAGVRHVAQALLVDGGDAGRAGAVAERVVELSVAPLLLRALMGEDAARLLEVGAARIDGLIGVLKADGSLAGFEAKAG